MNERKNISHNRNIAQLPNNASLSTVHQPNLIELSFLFTLIISALLRSSFINNKFSIYSNCTFQFNCFKTIDTDQFLFYLCLYNYYSFWILFYSQMIFIECIINCFPWFWFLHFSFLHRVQYGKHYRTIHNNFI